MRLLFARRPPFAVLFSGVLAALALSGAPAEAFVSEASAPAAGLTLRGSNGYQLSVGVESGFASIYVVEPGSKDGFGATTRYLRFGRNSTVSHKRLQLDFGHIARIAARFEPSGRVRRIRPPSFCEGGPEVIRFGVFVGKLRFHGEGGYTEVDARRARGTIRSSPRLVCDLRRARPSVDRRGRGALVTTLEASEPASSLAFAAVRTAADPSSSLFIAVSGERREGVQIQREAISIGPGSAFAPDPSLDSATVAPPFPFSGSASFQRLDDYTSRWEGPLTVSFPGRPDTPLTGRGFAWRLTSERQRGGVAVSLGNTQYSFPGGFRPGGLRPLHRDPWPRWR